MAAGGGGRETRGGKPSAVAGGLEFDAGEGGSGLLGLDHARGPAVDKEHVIGETMPGSERKFADRDPARRAQVRVGNIEHGPAGFREHSINLLTGGRLGRGHCGFGESSPGSEMPLQVNPLIVTSAFGYGK